MERILLENEPRFKTKDFQDAITRLNENDIDNEDKIKAIINIYSKTKDLFIRNACLKLLYNRLV